MSEPAEASAGANSVSPNQLGANPESPNQEGANRLNWNVKPIASNLDNKKLLSTP